MSPEEKELLRRSVALGEENNDILRSIQRSMRLARFMSILYWVVIIGASAGAYYFIQPYLQSVLDLYGGATNKLNQGSADIQSIIDRLK